MLPLRRVLLLCATVAFAACSTPGPEFTPASGAGTFPPTQFVDLLDSAPARPHVEIGTIDVPGEPGALRTQVLAQIRTRAQHVGADAVILKDRSYPAPASQRLNPTTGKMESIGGQMIPAFTGVAIRYK